MSKLKNRFAEIFSGPMQDVRFFHAPGRINIIGEHIDYNGGYVLPCALNIGTHALVRKNGDGTARFASLNFDDVIEITLNDVAYNPKHNWANYPMGVLAMMQADGHNFSGFDVLFSGNIPNGAGLSSSASIEMVMAVALNNVFGLGYQKIDLVQLAQRAENQFNGVNCGIMDQFAVGMARKNNALHLNCDTLEYKHVPMRIDGYKIVIMNTNKRRQLNESKYNERRLECDAALTSLSIVENINQLANISQETFEANKHLIKSEAVRKRTKHVISENLRVKQAVEALEAGNISILGELLNQSHVSLRDDYEVSCFELDTIVSLAAANPTCVGARMTGAGFGGCAIALVDESASADFMAFVAAEYEKIVGYAPSMYLCESGDGARELEECND